MITDQLIHGVPEELGIWLRERKPKSMQEAMEMADDYAMWWQRYANSTAHNRPGVTCSKNTEGQILLRGFTMMNSDGGLSCPS